MPSKAKSLYRHPQVVIDESQVEVMRPRQGNDLVGIRTEATHPARVPVGRPRGTFRGAGATFGRGGLLSIIKFSVSLEIVDFSAAERPIIVRPIFP